MNDPREAIAEDQFVQEAQEELREARERLVGLCAGAEPIRLDRIGSEERKILNAAQLCRTAENKLNAAVVAAVRDAL